MDTVSEVMAEPRERYPSLLRLATEGRLKILGGGWQPPVLSLRKMHGAEQEIPDVIPELALPLVYASAISFITGDRDEAIRQARRVARQLVDGENWMSEAVALAAQFRLGAGGGSFGVPSRIRRLLAENLEEAGTEWLLAATREAFDTPDMPVTRVAIHRDQTYGESYTFYFRRSPLANLRDSIRWVAAQRQRAMVEAGHAMMPVRMEDLDKSTMLIAEACFAALRDGYIFFIVGPTGVGKTTVQNALLLELGPRFSGPIVVLEAYPELEAHLATIGNSIPGIRIGYYYCMHGVAEEGEHNPLVDLTRVLTSGNVRLLVVQEANLGIASRFRDLFSAMLTSGVPAIISAFATVTAYTVEESEYAIGQAVASDLSYRLFGETGRLRRVAILILPALQLYLVDPEGTAHPLLGYGRDKEKRIAVHPHIRPVPETVAPRGSNLGRLLQAILSS